MKKSVRSCLRILAVGVVFGLLISANLPLWGQETTGELSGVAKDATGAVIVGANVRITNKATNRVFSTITGSDGVYIARDLEPGRYSVRFEMTGFAPQEVADVLLLVGRRLKVDASLQVSPVTQEVTVIETSPLLDLSTTMVSNNITAEEFDHLPKARTFQSLLVTSPSVNSGDIEGGFQVNGSSGAENQFVIDGISTTSLLNGKSRQGAVFEFIQEVQVKTAGIEAEYGGAMGGVLNAVTKTGGNAFHGDIHYYLLGNGINAGPVQRLLLDPSTERSASFVQDSKFGNNLHEFGGSLGGYFLKDKMWFYAAASPQWRRRSNDYLFNNGTEPGTIKQEQFSQNLFGKVSYDPAQRIRTNFTWLYTPRASTGTPPAYNGATNTRTSSLASNLIQNEIGFFAPQSSYSGNIDVTLSNRMILSVRGGRFWDNYKDTGIPDISAVVYQTSATDRTDIPVALRQPTNFQNTPRIQRVAHDLVTRTFVQADYSVFGHLWGDHDVKAGLGTMKNVNNVDNTYPGNGYVFVFWGRSFTSSVRGTPCNLSPCTGTFGYYEVDDFGTRGSTGANITHLYVQDKWRIHPRLTLSLGLRTEMEKVPAMRRDIKPVAFEFGFGDKLAPRLGASYDVLGNGNLKVSVSWGRFYDWVKYELARGSFGGDFWRVRYRSLDTSDVFSLSGTNAPGRDLWNPAVPDSFRNRRSVSIDAVDPNIKPMSTDLFNVSVEYQLSAHTVFRGSYVHNSLRRTIEDMGALDAQGDEIYVIGNPGEGLQAKCESAQANYLGCFPSSGATTPFAAPKPDRRYDAMELSVTRRFANGWFGSASYVFSRLFGNYAGLAASDEIRTPTTGFSSPNPQEQAGAIARQGGNVNRAWDIDEVLFDSHGNLNFKGRLPTDRPHVFKLYGSKTFKWGTEVGAFFYGASGTPLSTYVATLNQTEVFVEGRGDLGRTPILTQTDLMVGHEFKITEGKKLRVEFNMINLFNQKTARHIFNYLNRGAGSARPSSSINLANVDLFNGYDYNALINATPDQKDPTIGAFDPRYKMEDLWNPGFQGRLGIKFVF